MTRTMEIPERIYRRVERRGGECGYTVPKLTVLLYTSWLDGKISLGKEMPKDQLDEAYSRGFDFLKDEIDPSAPHDMATIRRNIAKNRKDFAR